LCSSVVGVGVAVGVGVGVGVRFFSSPKHDRLYHTCNLLTNLYFPHLRPALVTFAEYREKFVFRTTGVSEEDLQRSGAKFVALIVVTAENLNKPWYLTLKNRLSLPLPWFGRRR
jgi:hypothetical protein